MQKLLTKFPCLATSGRHNSAMITDRQKFSTEQVRTTPPPIGCLVSIFRSTLQSRPNKAGLKCPSVRTQKVALISMKFGM